MAIRLRDAHEKFKNFLKEKNKSTSTILAYGKDLDQLISFLEILKKENVHEVTKEDIDSFIVKMTKDGYNVKSLSRKLNSTRTFYHFLKINEYITDDPSVLVDHPKYDLGEPRILSPMEYRALRDVTRHDIRVYAIVEMLLQTGIRIAELSELRLKDIVKNQIHIAPIERHEERMVPINKPAQEALNRYLKIRENVTDDHVFITKTGRPFLIRNIRTSVERYFKIAEIKKATINDLKNTFIAHHLKHGVSIVILSKILGHKRFTTTRRYLKFIKDREKENSHLTEL